MNDDVVDYNGGTNRGYGSTRPKDYFAKNNIASAFVGADVRSRFGTVPRQEVDESVGYAPYTEEEFGYTHDNYDYPNNPGTIQKN